MMKKGLILLFAVFAAILLVGCGKTAEKEKDAIKVGLLLTGPTTDGGWNESAYNGLKQIEEKLGAEISFAESVQATDYEKTMRDYAKAGNDVIIGHGFQFATAGKAIAEEYPDIIFIITSATVTKHMNLG